MREKALNLFRLIRRDGLLSLWAAAGLRRVNFLKWLAAHLGARVEIVALDRRDESGCLHLEPSKPVAQESSNMTLLEALDKRLGVMAVEEAFELLGAEGVERQLGALPDGEVEVVSILPLDLPCDLRASFLQQRGAELGSWV